MALLKAVGLGLADRLVAVAYVARPQWRAVCLFALLLLLPPFFTIETMLFAIGVFGFWLTQSRFLPALNLDRLSPHSPAP